MFPTQESAHCSNLGGMAVKGLSEMALRMEQWAREIGKLLFPFIFIIQHLVVLEGV